MHCNVHCDKVCFAKDIFSVTVLDLYLLGRKPENGFCLIGQRLLLSSSAAALAQLLEALRISSLRSSSLPCAFHYVNHPPSPRSSGLRWPHSYAVLTVATRHSFRRCPDSVCDKGWSCPMFTDHAEAWGKSRRSARLISRSLYSRACRLWHLSCSPH